MRSPGVAAVALMMATAMTFAQQGGQLEGSITLRGGQVLTGKIQVAELGVVEGAGIGNSLPGRGAFVVKVGGDQPQRVSGDEVASVSVEWVNAGTEAEPQWEIKKLVIVKKDGSKVEGTPDWLLHASNVWVVTPDGQTKMVHAFPYGAEEFNPDNLITKIVIGTGSAAEAPAVAPQPGAQAPSAVKPAEGAEGTTPAEGKPAEAAAAQPSPTATAPTAPPTPPAETPPGPSEQPAQQPPAVTAPPAAQPVPATSQPASAAVLARDAMILLVRCPGCGQTLKIIISTDVVRVEHLSQ